MAQRLITFFIHLYQLCISPLFSHILGVKNFCRYNPTCSEYMLRMVKKYGVSEGVSKGLVQLAHCHPFAKPYGNI